MTDDPFQERIERMRGARIDFQEAESPDEAAEAAQRFFDLYDELVEILDPDGSWNTAP